jgi:hypothetical protein
MSEPDDSQHKLEQLIHRSLRELPLRKAPHTLEMRVLAEIERRSALAPSRFNFMSWPIVGRVAFILVCIATAKLLLVATSWGASRLIEALRFIPLHWVMGVLVFAAVLYAALFALGAVAYRTLSTER